MERIVLDADLRERLNGLKDQIEVYDEQGEKVGYFLPREYYRMMLIGWSRALVSDEELAEAMKQTGGRPLKEVMQDIQNQCATPSS